VRHFQGRLDAHALDGVDGVAHDVLDGSATHQLGQLCKRLVWVMGLGRATDHAPIHVAHKKSVHGFRLGQIHGRDLDGQGQPRQGANFGGEIAHRQVLAQAGVHHTPIDRTAHQPVLQALPNRL